jgi:hypothetical protein
MSVLIEGDQTREQQSHCGCRRHAAPVPLDELARAVGQGVRPGAALAIGRLRLGPEQNA